MSATLLTPAVQVCTFALGCALIHAGRRQATVLTPVLASVALATVVMVLITAAVVWAPHSRDYPGEVATYAAVAGQPPEAD